jgi:hypothetical protein
VLLELLQCLSRVFTPEAINALCVEAILVQAHLDLSDVLPAEARWLNRPRLLLASSVALLLRLVRLIAIALCEGRS